jgi:N-acetylmuramoyl-L-alanine amidase
MTMLFSIALIWGIVYFDPVSSEETHEMLRQLKTSLFERKPGQELVVPDEPKVPYAYVNTYRLNVRSRPSSEGNVVAVLEENARVEVVEKSGIWWKVKFENIEGYVVSDYLKQ